MEAGHPALSLELPAVPRSVAEARHAVAAVGASCDVDSDALATAVSEAVGNAVFHAYRSGAEKGRIHVRARIEGGDVFVEVSDDGVGMKPHPDAGGLGMGLGLIGAVTSEVRLDTSDKGLKVMMRFKGPGAEAAQAPRSASGW